MSKPHFSFGEFAFDAGRDLLSERGVPVQMGRRALALLRTLLLADGNVVDKAALMDAAWPGLYVEESNLTVQMAALRKRLGPAPDGGDWIATFPRIGYRFAGPLTRSDANDQPASRIQSARASSQSPAIPLAAYELYVRARQLLLQSPSGNALARAYLVEALQREPLFAPAHACLGIARFGDAIYFHQDTEANRAAGLMHVTMAMRLAPDDPTARWASGFVHLYSGLVEHAQRDWELALELAPNQPEILAKLGDLEVQGGRPDGGVALAERAVQLHPNALPYVFWDLGFAHYAAGQYEKAVTVLRRPELDRLPAKRILAAALAQLGRVQEARDEARLFLRDSPGFTIATWASTQAFHRRYDLDHFTDGYARAGLPR